MFRDTICYLGNGLTRNLRSPSVHETFVTTFDTYEKSFLHGLRVWNRMEKSPKFFKDLGRVEFLRMKFLNVS